MRFRLLCRCLVPVLTLALPATAQDTVTVREGDTLFSIASATMGAGLKWPELCAFNAQALGGDCDRLRPGMVLRVPGAQPAPVPDPAPDPEPAADPAPDPAPDPEAEAREPAPEPAPEADAPADPVEAGDAAAAPVPAITPSIALADAPLRDVVFDFGAWDVGVFETPEGLSAEHLPDEGLVRLSGTAATRGDSARTGAHIALPAAFEAAANGEEIRVEMLVRLSAPGALEIAYSLGNGGDSGWQRVELGAAHERLEARYRLPRGTTGGADYLGLRPDPDGTGQSLDVLFIGISVVE